MKTFALVAALLATVALAPAAAAEDAGPAPAAPAAAAPKSALIPTEALAHRPLYSRPQLSPDGQWLLAELGDKTKGAILLAAITTGELRTFALPKGWDLVSYRWAGNGKVLISVGKSLPLLGEDAFVTRLISYDLATRKGDFVGSKMQGPEGDDILYVDPDGKWLLLSIQKTIYDYPSVFRIDLVSGDMKEVVRPRDDVWEWYADKAGVVRAGIGFQQNKWSLVYRASESAPFKRAGSARYDDHKASLRLIGFSRDSDQGYVLSSEKTGRTAVYRFNYATLETGELVFESKTNDISDIYLSDDSKTIQAAFYTDDRDRVEWFDPQMKQIQSALDTALKGKEAWIVSRSRDGSRMLVLVTGANDPGSYYYFQPAAGVMNRLAFVNERMKGYKLAPSKPVSYEARDGLVIHGYLTLPTGREAKGLPLVILPHGGPFGIRDRGDYDPEVQFLANRGYAVLQPNYRGSESYGKAFEEQGRGQWGRAMQDDLDDGMDWLVKQGIADPKRVCIVGASYGGYAAMWGATRNPERYRCAASFAGVSDIGRQLKHFAGIFSGSKSNREFNEFVRGAKDFDLSTVSPLAQVERLKVPLLIAHGDADQQVPFKLSVLYTKALEKAGKPFEYKVYPGEAHGFDKPEDLQDWLDRLEGFLKKYNPPD